MGDLKIRLQQARKAAGLSLRALGDLVSLSHAAIKKYEDGKVYPPSDVLLKLAKALHVRVDFFFRPIKVCLENVKFRKRQKLSRKAEEEIKFDVISQIERRLELENLYPSAPTTRFELPTNFPKKVTNFDEIESFAEKLRSCWKLGLAPIHNLIDAFESHGVRVFIVDSEEEYFDGLSTVINDHPIIVIGSRWPGDRQRFSLAHELAHYIFANRLSSAIDEEQACNRFAGAFLFPRKAVLQVIGARRHAIEWPELCLIKDEFQISMGAICHRIKDLGIIQDSYYDKLVNSFRRKGWKRTEPGPGIPPEKTHAFDQMLFHALGEGYIGEPKAAELLACSLDHLKGLLQVHNSHALTRTHQ